MSRPPQPWTRLAVVPLPAEIDIANARQIGDELLAAVAGGTAVIADMSRTTFCDSSGISILALVRRQAMASDATLILVVTSAAVLRTLSLTGLSLLLPIYPSVSEALPPECVPWIGILSPG